MNLNVYKMTLTIITFVNYKVSSLPSALAFNPINNSS